MLQKSEAICLIAAAIVVAVPHHLTCAIGSGRANRRGDIARAVGPATGEYRRSGGALSR